MTRFTVIAATGLIVATGLIAAFATPPAAIAQSADHAAAEAGETAPLLARLNGTAEVPSADEDGTGTFKATLNDTHDQLCYELKVDKIDQANAAHIHEGAVGKNGAPVVMLQAPANGVANGCATVTADLAIKLTQHPEAYYVNVHNAAYPNGALRGQLGR